jgi:zinc transport system substrate-binding protein
MGDTILLFDHMNTILGDSSGRVSIQRYLFRIPALTGLVIMIFSASAIAADRISVFVSIVPQKYFVQQIGKELVDVRVMVQPGESPATYEPKPRQMAALSDAEAYFAIGVPFEQRWLKKITAANPAMKVVHTDHGIEKISMATHHHHGEAQGDHKHHRLDPHIWLSPPLVKIQARTTMQGLQAIDPAHRAVYQDNCRQFISRIDALDLHLKAILTGIKGRQFIVFHPSWGYFAHAYGLHQLPIEIEGKDPKPAQLKELIEHARENDIRFVFAQPQFSAKSAQLVAREIGGKVVFADPLDEDWMDNLSEVADSFAAAFRQRSGDV